MNTTDDAYGDEHTNPLRHTMKGQPPCTVPGCNRSQLARGWCMPHYQRWRRTGKAGDTEIRHVHSPTDSTEDRLDYYTEKIGDHAEACWLWRGAISREGYGRLNLPGGSQAAAHLLMYERENGPVPDGLELDHLCRVRMCVRPSHVEAVPHGVNVQRGDLAVLTPELVAAIRWLYKGGKFTQKQLADQFGTSRTNVGHIVRGESWAAVDV